MFLSKATLSYGDQGGQQASIKISYWKVFLSLHWIMLGLFD